MKILLGISLTALSVGCLANPIGDVTIILEPNPMYQVTPNPPYTPESEVHQTDFVNCYFKKGDDIKITQYEGRVTSTKNGNIRLETDKSVIFLPMKDCLVQRGTNE